MIVIEIAGFEPVERKKQQQQEAIISSDRVEL